MIENRCCHIYANVSAWPEVESWPLLYPDPVTFLLDLDILQEIFVSFDLDRRLVTLRYHDFCSPADVHVLKIADMTILCLYISISVNPFPHDIPAGANSDCQCESDPSKLVHDV